MENIYLDSSRLSFREFLRYILLTIALATAFMSMELIGVRLIKAEYLINMLYEGMLVFILLQTISSMSSGGVQDYYEDSYNSIDPDESGDVTIIPDDTDVTIPVIDPTE